jgi:hypothetical protein
MAFANGGRIVTNGLVVSLDANDKNSYPGSGTTWFDISGNGWNGGLQNGISYSSANGGSFTLDGTDDTVTTNFPVTSVPALSNFSIDCWMKIPSYPTVAAPNVYGSTTKTGVLIGATYYGGTALFWSGNATGTAFSVFAFIRGADAYRATSTYSVTSLNTYYYFTLVNNYSASTFNLYVNGSLHSSVAGPTQEYNPSFTPNAGNIGISKAQVDGGGTQNYTYLACTVASAKIYNTALSATQVAQNYNSTKSRFSLK